MVRLEPATRDNWKEALKLQVLGEQDRFVPSVAVSLAKVSIRPDGAENEYFPFCIYNAADTLVGFVMITANASTDWSYWLNGFLIDAAHQGKGYGTAAIGAVIGHVRTRYPHSQCLNLTVCAENERARTCYEKSGFVETGDVYDGELVYRLTFPAEPVSSQSIVSNASIVGLNGGDRMAYSIRPITELDIPFLREMLYESLYVPEGQEPFSKDILREPHLAKYVEGWGKEGDIGFIAMNADEVPVGSITARSYSEENKGYGFVGSDVPELGMAILKPYRGSGIGKALLTRLFEELKIRRVKQLSLSVDPSNLAAVKLYERFGFAEAGRVGTSMTMVSNIT